VYNFKDTRKKANMAAHSLEKAAIQQSLEQIWMKNYLVFIHDMVTDESIVLLSF